MVGVEVTVESWVVELVLKIEEEEDDSNGPVEEGTNDEVVWSELNEDSTELDDASAEDEVKLSS